MSSFRFCETRSTVELLFAAEKLSVLIKDQEVTVAVYNFENGMSGNNFQILFQDMMHRIRRMGYRRQALEICLKIFNLTARWRSKGCIDNAI